MRRAHRACLPILGLALLIGSAAEAQYLYEERNEAGAITSLTFVGDSEWLVAQEDPRSHWHLLPELSEVTLQNFRVSREALQYVLSLKALKVLVLGLGPEGVEIEKGDLALLPGARQLEHLGRCLAGLSDEDLGFLPRMDQLESLSIHPAWDPGKDSDLGDALAEVLVKSPKLTWISIDSGNFSDEFVRTLSARRDLESLELSSPHLTDASLARIGQWPALRRLRIRSPLLTDAGIAQLGGLESLEELVVEAPRLGSGALTQVSGLSRLTFLELSLAEVRTEDLATVQNLKSLEILALRQAPIGDGELAVLHGHPSLRNLFFEHARPTLKSLPVIASLGKLEYVKFSTGTEDTRLLLGEVAKRKIQDGSFYPAAE